MSSVTTDADPAATPEPPPEASAAPPPEASAAPPPEASAAPPPEASAAPPPVGDHVTVLEHEGRTLYIIGTAHVSQLSVDEVNHVIETVRPDTVCIELCEARYHALTDESRWRKLDIFKVIREGKTLFLLANLAVGAYQRRLGEELGVKPGAELLAGIKKAEEIGAEVVLADRDIHITLKRTWGNLGFWKKTKLMGAIMGSLFARDETDGVSVEDLKEQTHLSEMMAEFSRVMPEVKEPLIDERDQYLMAKLREAPGDTVVCVVGAGHVEGMQKWQHKPIDIEALKELPKKFSVWSLIKWLVPLALIVTFYFGIKSQGTESIEAMLQAWILPNAIFAAVFTALAGAKVISIISAAIASPITSLNPMLGAGMVVGVIEAWLRKPTVEDAENINRDVQTFKGFYRNAFTRVLLVAFAATLGSALGAWVGLPWVISVAT